MFLDQILEIAQRSIFRYDSVLQYLAGRNVFEEDIKKFRVGYLKVFSVSDDGSEDYKRFMKETWKGRKLEDMMLFPITDALGRNVGFIARSPSTKQFTTYITDEAKYNGFVFGLYQALPEIYKTGRVYVVEGPFDTYAVSKVLPNTVGSLTAGLYDNQYGMLTFYCDRVITLFDHDEAGIEATRVAQEKYGTQGMHLGYKDPSDCLAKMSLPAFIKHVKSVVPMF